MNPRKVLYVAQEFAGLNTGKSVVSYRNLCLLQDAFGKENVFEHILKPVVSRKKMLLDNLSCYIGGLSKKTEAEIIHRVKTEGIHILAVDGSIYGSLAKAVKTAGIKCRVIVFYHNVEYLYFKFLMKRTRKFWHYLTLWVVLRNEKLNASYADDLIVLNSRDSEKLYEIYKRKADFNLPVSYQDRYDHTKNAMVKEPVALFIGSLFFPNYSGIKWFIRNVIPRIDCKLVIVGTGFETVRNELQSDKVEVIGGTKDIDPYYYNSSFVIAPVFEGSGMKTKTAEALMFGKTVFGTKEAFEGYTVTYNDSLVLCETSEDFIARINHFINTGRTHLNENSRKLFVDEYSYEAVSQKFRNYIDNNCK